jgi:hypothetical protein
MTKQEKSKIELAAEKVTKAESNHRNAIDSREKARVALKHADEKVEKTGIAIFPAKFAFDRIARELHTPPAPKSKTKNTEYSFSLGHFVRSNPVIGGFCSVDEARNRA